MFRSHARRGRTRNVTRDRLPQGRLLIAAWERAPPFMFPSPTPLSGAASAENVRHTSQEWTPLLLLLLLEFAGLPTGLDNRTFPKLSVCLPAARLGHGPSADRNAGSSEKYAARASQYGRYSSASAARSCRFSFLFVLHAPVCTVGCQIEMDGRGCLSKQRRPLGVGASSVLPCSPPAAFDSP